MLFCVFSIIIIPTMMVSLMSLFVVASCASMIQHLYCILDLSIGQCVDFTCLASHVACGLRYHHLAAFLMVDEDSSLVTHNSFLSKVSCYS